MSDEISEQDQRDIEALVDGTLSGDRREAFEERVSVEPDLQRRVEQAMAERVSAARRSGEDHEHPEVAARARRGGPRPTLALLVGLAAGVAVLLAGMLFVVTAANNRSIDAARVAEISVRVADMEPPAADPNTPTLLAEPFADVAYPRFEEGQGFVASGARVDVVEGRTVRTVHYDGDGTRITYSVVSGPPLAPPPGAAATVVGGVTTYSVASPLGSAVAWERLGRTCVLSGNLPEKRLRALAVWNGDGTIPF